MLGTPDVFGQFRVVHKGVAVALFLVNALVADQLLLADGVGAVPLHQHLHGPVGECLVLVVQIIQLVAAGPVGNVALVAGHHVEIDARKVALILVVGLKDLVRIAVVSALAQLAQHGNAQFLVDIGDGIRSVANAIGVVAAALIDIAVGGDNHHEVGVHGINLAAKPALGERVFAVESLAHIGSRTHMIGAVVVLAGGVHVDVITVITHVGGRVAVPQLVVSQLGVSVDDALQSRHQSLVALAVGIGVKAAGDIGHSRQAHQHSQ